MGCVVVVRGARDHPRSRGVYGVTATSDQTRAGSSPLARGLRRRSPRLRGIGGDHPRSRGVYRKGEVPLDLMAGSSPLARGLPERANYRYPDGGIIPARARFTFPPGRSTVRSGDHPRSRGVYNDAEKSGLWPSGSSPLARGLPQQHDRRLIEQRIIPARAGFTMKLIQRVVLKT